MQLFNGLTIDEVIDRQNDLFIRIPVEIDPYSRENDCYPNCVAKSERDGGLVVVGWRRTCVTIARNWSPHWITTLFGGTRLGARSISARVRFFNGQLERIVDLYSYFMIDPTAIFRDPNCSRPSGISQWYRTHSDI